MVSGFVYLFKLMVLMGFFYLFLCLISFILLCAFGQILHNISQSCNIFVVTCYIYVLIVGLFGCMVRAIVLISQFDDIESNLWLSSGNMLTFMVGQKQAFEVSLADVSQTQLQGKNDVILEFHVDDTTGANEVGWLTCVA